MKFRKKQIVIEAIQFNGKNWKEMEAFFDGFPDWKNCKDGTLAILTLEGTHKANIGDWILKGVKGEFYPCKPDIFEMTYEKVTE